jgi:hypothetical protein
MVCLIAPLALPWSAPLLRGNQRPAHNRTAHGTPAAEPLIDLRGQGSLLLGGQTNGFDLPVGNVAHRNPARGIRPHWLATKTSTASPISDTSPKPLKPKRLFEVSKPKKSVVRTDDVSPPLRTIFGGRALSFGSCPELALNSVFALARKTDFPTALGNPAKCAGFPLSHRPGGDCGFNLNRTFHLLQKADILTC